MAAARELRDYRHRIAAQERGGGARLMSVRPGPSIRLDKSLKTSSTIFFSDDMENGANGWTSQAYTGSDLWHQSALNANSPTHSWWPGVELAGNYATGARVNDALISPPINLTAAAGSVTLLFTENYVTEAGWDFCMVDASTDGGSSWTHLRGGYGNSPSGDSYGWVVSSVDLTPFAGQTVNIRFYFDTGDSLLNDFPGWFVDNAVVFDEGGTIAGKTFFDVNNNGVKDSTDRGMKEWLVTATGNGIAVAVKTNFRGHFAIPLPLGSYTVVDEQKAGWTQTFPSPFPSQYALNLATPDTLVDSVWFGNFTNASFVEGTLFNDVNQDSAYSPGTDSLLADWRVILSDTLGTTVDYDYTDSLGYYQLFVLQPGQYVVSEAPGKLHHGWVETFPSSETYAANIPDLSTTLAGRDFGNYFAPTTNAVIGEVYNDRNRNQLGDPDESGAANFRIRCQVSDTGTGDPLYNRTHVSDSAGFFIFQGLPSGNVTVTQLPFTQKNVGWWPSFPASPYQLFLAGGATLDSVDFGDYQIVPGAITGTVFNDANGNAVSDSGETGLSGWSVSLTTLGTTPYGTTSSGTALTAGDGSYSFPGLWPGTYIVSEVFHSGWRQTLPVSLHPRQVALGVEQTASAADFGNVQDSTFSLSFRTFLPESLALALDNKGKSKPVLVKPVADEFTMAFVNNERADSVVQKMFIKLSPPVPDTLQISPPGTQVFTLKRDRVDITFAAPIDSGDTVIIHGIANKPKPETGLRWKWIFPNGKQSVLKPPLFVQNRLLLPMPNAINVLAAGAGTLLRVGLGGPHTVLHLTYKDVMKSLVDSRRRMHIGDPRCLGTYANMVGKSIKKQLRSLTPTQGNNKFFAEAIAFQANIKASDLGVTPGGFGNLVFDDGTSNPLNGKTLREIGGVIDAYMSSYRDSIGLTHCTIPAGYEALDSLDFYGTIRKIDSAFSGPMDTVRFYSGLELTAVHPLAAVPFLRLDTAAARPSAAVAPRYTGFPERTTLAQNYPNPFNPTTTIEFYLVEPGVVTLTLYNTLGQEVARLIDHQTLDEGWGDARLSSDALGLASGVYFYRLTVAPIADGDLPAAPTSTLVRKMMFIK